MRHGAPPAEPGPTADAPLPGTQASGPDPERAYLSGIQALVRLPMLQRLRDAAAGLDTAGFISGYRGSPLGGLDQALWKAGKPLAEHRIHFQPGINEDLAATAVWGSQQVNLFPGAKHDGVFALWYGKGPGADRSVDVFKHANAAGTSRHGGVLAVVGDDHGAKSSSLPHQSDHVFAASMIPVLNPAGVQDLLDFGLHGWAMSRFSGCWVGLRALSDIVETSTGVILDPHRVETRLPLDFQMPPGGLSIRWPDPPLEQEYRLQHWKVYAAMAYARANHLNRVVIDSPQARFGIISSGKSYLDLLQALDALGIDERLAAKIGLRVYKVGMTWPLDGEGVRHFAEGLEEILVVEEKRQVIEYQLKEQLYNWREDVRPKVTGKYDEKGEWGLPGGDWQLPAAGELTPALIARVIARRIAPFHTSARIRECLDFLAAKEAALARPHPVVPRAPHYCSGCPHNTSTRVPEGSRALAGIGCHYMALWLNPDQTRTFSQMGGEGVPWIGQAPFTETRHVFANLGDGTYSHSGLLAIRQAVVAKVPITYKILVNDAVAMTGGQPVEGTLTVPQIVRQVAAEGVGRIVVVTDDPARHPASALPAGVPVRHRRDLDAVQRELRDDPGVSVLVYDQTCAAEKRRRRKRGLMPDPARRVVINDRVCEGCGDCSAKSNCMSVVPVETEFGRKRAIDQSSCNKDFSCLEGFCPSFVTVEGGRLRKGQAAAPAGDDAAGLPEPPARPLGQPYGILVAGVGGTGVVTIGALLGTAAALEGKGVSVLDMAGLAQKGGPVWSHIRLAARQDMLHASRIASGEADLLLGCDIVVAVADESLSKLHSGTARAVVNRDFSVTSDFVRGFAAQARTGDVATQRDPHFPVDTLEEQITEAVGPGRADFIAGTRLATALQGDSIATNLFMVGYAYQKGLLPISASSLLRAIELNGAAVEMNKGAFHWGRRAALDLAAVERVAMPPEALPAHRRLSASLDEVIARRVTELTAYQDARYARRYADLVRRVREAEAARTPGRGELTEAVAKGHYKLLATKDEYEVARLYTQTGFLELLERSFEGDTRLVFHLAPPLWARIDPATGEPRKRAFGPWMLHALRVLARLRRLRGTAFDPFRFSEDRKLDRRLLAEYEHLVDELIATLHASNHALAVELASLPEQIRGYGPVRRRHAEHAKRQEARLLKEFRRGDAGPDESGERVPEAPVLMRG
ncbi:indolepyruvate ferredoxin oxidoreductase family protein [Roseomonas marmotae]|uniref:Indolepyruvate ferredoxin oxidoreductase family protein n=1 Tax=Roseomonas marmotae TaxID=2768161 RepID=A0ABS3KC71_9PROT|nr:indolepyruvate ferredoxin oxidoreductase family protein [Roseomonas marmotae]MBO1075069.1 indolepyruvate ferredoxin oxidoreductase family protein [Roseomonas marmotae]QTI79901.1 indolepyruvate ferredoxin oxidoreductase family protein [Roseomonas marmotae]